MAHWEEAESAQHMGRSHCSTLWTQTQNWIPTVGSGSEQAEAATFGVQLGSFPTFPKSKHQNTTKLHAFWTTGKDFQVSSTRGS